MSRAACDLSSFLVPIRWFRAGNDPSRPDDSDQCADRTLIPFERPIEMQSALSQPSMRVGMERRSASIAHTIKAAAKGKSP
jgi:hypothetical protein